MTRQVDAKTETSTASEPKKDISPPVYVPEDPECTHEYVEDLIDIDPERSQIIYYCLHCLHTQK